MSQPPMWIVVMVLLTSLISGIARAEPFTLDDCNRPETHRVLAGETRSGKAQAVWLDATRILWPQAPVDARYVLLRDPATMTVGEPLPVAVEQRPLRVIGASLSGADRPRFGWLGSGVVLDATAETNGDTEPHRWWRYPVWLVRVDSHARVAAFTRLQIAGALDAHFAAADSIDFTPLASETETRLRLWAPTAQQVGVCVYADSNAPATEVDTATFDAALGIWTWQRNSDLRDHYSTWLVDVFVPATGWVRQRVTDPYAISLSANGRRNWLGSLQDPETLPEHWQDAPRPAAAEHAVDQIIYELHVRDFSRDDVRVPMAHRGKYLGFTHTDSHGMQHLRALAEAGLTDIHLLPVFDFSSVPETDCVTPEVKGAATPTAWRDAISAVKEVDCFNWGYDPQHFGAPEGSYATNADQGALRIREFRTMVQALHAIGLRVGMDVVYNHSSHAGLHEKSVLDRIVPGYYHRLDAEGAITRSTCCENTATEHRMMAKLMIDTAVRWVREYRIDGFRFDLMGHQPKSAMLRLQSAVNEAAGRSIPLLGEGWNFGEVADGARFEQASQLSLNGSGIATFSDRARDAVRGGGCCDGGIDLIQKQGWVNGLFYAPNTAAQDKAGLSDLQRSAALLRIGLGGSLRSMPIPLDDGRLVPAEQIDYAGHPAGYVREPGEVVNYVENHDNPTLFDINALKLPLDTSSHDRARVQILALATVAFSQGVAYFHAGGELLRSKSLDRNSFNSGDAFNRLDWSGQSNQFGIGLPPSEGEDSVTTQLVERLRDPRLRPSAEDIAWTRDAFLDLLRIRSSTPALRLRSAEEIRRRLYFPRTTTPVPSNVILMGIRGEGEQPTLLIALNADVQPIQVTIDEEHHQSWQRHPAYLAASVSGVQHQAISLSSGDGTLMLPPRSASAWMSIEKQEHSR